MGLFKPATKHQAKARIAIAGPAGSGKTYTALRLAKAMGQKVAGIDTEHGSMSLYSKEFPFDSLELTSFHPDRYVEAIEAAAKEGYEVLVIDSASHEWNGKDGCLELKELFARRSKGGNDWAAWADVTPLHTRFIEAIHAAPMHIIATFRSKMDTVQVEENGRKTIKKVGMAPITREGAEYEFDIVLELDIDHVGTITKSRSRQLADKAVRFPGEALATEILAWLSDGAPALPKAEPALQPAPAASRPYRSTAAVENQEAPPGEDEHSALAGHVAKLSDEAIKAGRFTTATRDAWLAKHQAKRYQEVADGPLAEMEHHLAHLLDPQP